MISFQDAILRLQTYWVNEGALLWQPYSEKVGAGTMNPATILRVLGPEPWNVVYTEPSYRPDDGRYADNPNRMQMHTQLQVILKPDPGDPQELYLKSLEVLGIHRHEHDIRFVEDNWESPALGAWGLGWEVWLDGQEITQFTYFQQAGGITLEVPAVEITYGLERIVMYLQHLDSVWNIQWDENHTYGELMRGQEIDHCRYDFEIADIDRLRKMYVLSEQEAKFALQAKLIVPALDYILRCSHIFNLLDSRGTVGVTERSVFFKRIRDLSRQMADLYLERRKELHHPWMHIQKQTELQQTHPALMQLPLEHSGDDAAVLPQNGFSSFLVEIGVEELPVEHQTIALDQLKVNVISSLHNLKLSYDDVFIWVTPRRIIIYVNQLSNQQPDEEIDVKGPPANIAFDDLGNRTKAAYGFARSQGVDADSLTIRQTDEGAYIYAQQMVKGQPAREVLSEVIPEWIANLSFPRIMRWQAEGVSFSRPIRWLVAMLGEEFIPFSYAGLESGRITRGPRYSGSLAIALSSASDYVSVMRSQGVLVDVAERRAEIIRQVELLTDDIGGHFVDDLHILDEVVNLVEVPIAILGSFDKRFLSLPQDVLIGVMGKHQRYLPVVDSRGRISPYFVTVRNGGSEHNDIVRQGNEAVLRARYADAAYFYDQDCRVPLESFRKKLDTLVFHDKLGSMLDKSNRLLTLGVWVGDKFALTGEQIENLERAAYLCKADLVTKMVIEMTSLQGIMGREYARKSGENLAVADAIMEHHLPRYSGDKLPQTLPGMCLSITDRLDSLAGLFAIGLKPTGSTDPYGLRRTTNGLIYILLDQKRTFSIRTGLLKAAENLPVPLSDGMLNTAVEFIESRLRVILRELGFAYDVVEAVLVYKGDDPYLAYTYAQQLTEWMNTNLWSTVLQSYARCVRITRDTPPYTVNPQQFASEIERRLWNAVKNAVNRINTNSDVDTFLKSFIPLIDLISVFFENVMVMVDDMKLRQTRIALLQCISALPNNIVDLSRLEGF
jgi:glycyl-tRNA synthetase